MIYGQTLELSSLAEKQQALAAVYDVYADWVAQFSLACRKGCGACCTRSVTMTDLEGSMIIEFVQRNSGQQWLVQKLSAAAPGNYEDLMTTNQFAEACLNRQEVPKDSMGCWDFAPCIFLEDDACTIYEARPFGCRSFASHVQCAPGRAAEITPVHLTVNTVFCQLIEHINSDGGFWSTMTDILYAVVDSDALPGKPRLLPARSIPGFLLEPGEVNVLRMLIKQIDKRSPAKEVFGDLIDKFIPI